VEDQLTDTILRARSATVDTGFASDRAQVFSERIIFSPNRQHFGYPRARPVSGIGFGREDAICEYIEIMQISPVRATMRRL
jgi:hypothetical protein